MKEQYTILLVEDDPDLNTLLKEFFEGLGYAIHTAFWGEEGLDLVKTVKPDLIVQDVNLPGIDGFEVVRQLRDQQQTRSLPVIFLTDKSEREHRMTGLQLGAVSYMSKPFELTELRLRVRNVLKRTAEGSPLNSITKLPEVWAVQKFLNEKLNEMDWGAMYLSLRGVANFKEQYGFLAADDVVRAAGVIISKTINETFQKEDFVGHLDYADFLVLSDRRRIDKLVTACEKEFEHAIPFFYPENSQPDQATEHLNVVISRSNVSEMPSHTADALCDALRLKANLYISKN